MTAASCEISRRRRASPHIRYSGSDSTSSATNSVTRSRRRRENHHPADGEQRQREHLGLHRGRGTAVASPVAGRPDLGGRLGDERAAGLGHPVGHQQHRRQGQHQQHAPHRRRWPLSTATAPSNVTPVVVVHGADDGPAPARGDHHAERSARPGSRTAPPWAGPPRKGRRRTAPPSTISTGRRIAEVDVGCGDRVGRSRANAASSPSGARPSVAAFQRRRRRRIGETRRRPWCGSSSG